MTNVRATHASEYDMGDGWVVEQFRYWNGSEFESWALPAWEEKGLPHLAEVFPTLEAANAAIAAA